MECREAQQLLDAFVADELGAAERQTIENHLAECPVCRKEAEALRGAISLLGQFKEMDPPAVFLQELRQRMERSQRRGILGRLLPRPVFARVLTAVSCVLVAGFGVWLAVKQFVPPRKMEERYAGDKLEDDRIALLDKKEKGLEGLSRNVMPGKAVSEEVTESLNGDIPAGDINFRNGAFRGKEGASRMISGRPGDSSDDATVGTGATGAPLAPPERPAEPPPAPAATAAPSEPALAGYVAQRERRERLAEKRRPGEAGRMLDKASVSEPASESVLSEGVERTKGERAAGTDVGQMARGGAAGAELKLDEKKEDVTLTFEKKEAGEFYERASQKARQPVEDEEKMALARRHAAEPPEEETARLRGALQLQPEQMDKSHADFAGEKFSIPADVVNGSKADWGNMTGQTVLEQKDSAPGQWYFYGLGDFARGYDRFDSPMPQLVIYVGDIQQARSEIQKAAADAGGSVEDAVAWERKEQRGEEGEETSFAAEQSTVLFDSFTGLALRDRRTDSLVVRLKGGTYEAFRQKLLPRRAGVVSGPQPTTGAASVFTEGVAQQKETEITLLIRLVEISQQQIQETQPAQTQQPTP